VLFSIFLYNNGKLFDLVMSAEKTILDYVSLSSYISMPSAYNKNTDIMIHSSVYVYGV
jgi:hypothetical protein